MVQENLKRPYSKDVEAFQLIKSMLEVEPAVRPTAEATQESILLLLKKVIKLYKEIYVQLNVFLIISHSMILSL